MRNIMPNTATLAVCSSITQLYCIARIRLFVAALSGLFDQQHTGSLPWVGRQAGLSIPGCEAPDDLCLLRLPFAQVHKVQSGLAAFASGPGGLGTGYSCRVIDTGALGTSDELYKSFCVCSEDRKYFSGASGIKIADKEHPCCSSCPQSRW